MLKFMLIGFTVITIVCSEETGGSDKINTVPYPLQSMDRAQNSVASGGSSEMMVIINELMSTITAMLSNAVKDGLVFALNNAGIVLLSSVLTLVLCNFTNICADINQVTPFRQIQLTIKFMATPERIMNLADFVHGAIKKYTDMQMASL